MSKRCIMCPNPATVREEGTSYIYCGESCQRDYYQSISNDINDIDRDLFSIITQYMKLADVISLCRTNTKFNLFCKDETWKRNYLISRGAKDVTDGISKAVKYMERLDQRYYDATTNKEIRRLRADKIQVWNGLRTWLILAMELELLERDTKLYLHSMSIGNDDFEVMDLVTKYGY